MQGRAVNDRASLRAETLALLLEPLGVDAMVGPAALRRFATEVDVVAQARGCAGLPPSGSTLPWVSDAVAACVEEYELARLTTAGGRTPAPDGGRSLRELKRLDGLRTHLQALEGVPVEALRADAGAVAVAGRLLPEVLEPCRRADQEWPKEIWRSIREIDIEPALADLSRRRGGRKATEVRELVLRHSTAAARDLRNRELVPLLEKVRDFVATEESYEAVLSARPQWWRWLAPDARFGFRTDRRDALLWAIEARDTGVVSGSTVDMLADDGVRAVIEHGFATAPVNTAVSPAVPAVSSAARLTAGLLAVASRTGIDELRAFESWYAKNVESFDRVAAAMDLGRTEPDLREALGALAGELASGAVDTSRSAYRDIQTGLQEEAEARLSRTSYSEHAIESQNLVEIISRIGALERELRDALQVMPAARGRLRVAIAGRTKSGKTTLTKALTRDADRTGIGRGAHRTTRETSAFQVGSVTYLDTPGVAAKDDDLDATRARAACDSADAVIWNYADTLREEESAELQRLLLAGKPLLAVVNVKGKVDEPHRLQRFANDPEREFASATGHTVRIEQVSSAVGVTPPVVLPVHSGAAHEALSTADRELGDRALRASRLPELEQSLTRLLADRAIPLRAVRQAEGVRAPVAAFHDRLIKELPGIDLALAGLEGSTSSDRAALLEAFRAAGQDTRDRLEAGRHRAKERLPDVIRDLGGMDDAQRWSDFVTGLELEGLLSALENEFEREARKRGMILHLRASARGPQDDTRPRVRPRPDLKEQAVSLGTAAAKGAATALLGSVAAKGIPKKLAVPPPAAAAVYVAETLAGAAKAVSGEVVRARRAKDGWTSATRTEAEAWLDETFDGLAAWLAGVTDAATAQVDAQSEARSADISRTRERLERLCRLRPSVRSALDAIDLVLARRLLALAGGDPAAIRLARRTPGVELRVWTDASRVAEVRACLRDQFVDVLTERLEISRNSGCLGTLEGTEGNTDG
ncbi:GTPase [Streptomyces rubiginosohelvolus]|uniref:GTPase n=1 Tax=Streptomyces rubiginosohelvolus TaxID=67362 RepID=UPI003722DEE6